MTADVIAALDEQITGAFERWRQRPDSLESRLVRVSVAIPETNVYDWLAAQTETCQVLWKSKRDQQRVAGVGCADLVSGGAADDYHDLLARCRKFLGGAEGARYFGGFSFQPDSVDDDGWYSFSRARFWLPRFEMTGNALTCNLLFRADRLLTKEDVLQDLAALVFPDQYKAPNLPKIVNREDFPDESGWEGNVLAALSMIDKDVLEKIVLARRADYRFAEPASAAEIMAKLSRVTTNCFHFILQPDRSAGFMGTTPERLFKLEGRDITSEVIAGTRPRSENVETDRAYSEALLNSEKDQREHDIVRKAMRQKLHLLCDHLEIQDDAELLLLERKQHLISRISGRLAKGKNGADLLSSLHPTPAVGGYPRENALREIRRLEPFSRGWYASPVGWVSENACEFAVAIRSGLVQDSKVSVYSGAGIVAGSDPREEWQEIENKISDFVKVTQ